MNSLGSLIIRIPSGERLRKARPDENRSGAVMFFVIALAFELVLLGQKYRPSAVEKIFGGTAFELWVAWTLVILSGVLVWYILWKRVPVKVMVALAVLAWSVLLGTMLAFGVFVGNLP